jgi:hypothetical protein
MGPNYSHYFKSNLKLRFRKPLFPACVTCQQSGRYPLNPACLW